MSFALEMHHIGKNFGKVQALSDVNFSVYEGEIHALCGENGAGKSTLMKILSGVYPSGQYTGEIRIGGESVEFKNPKESEQSGICIIYQELALIPEMTVCENIFLGQEPLKYGLIDWDFAYSKTQAALAHVKLDVHPSTYVSSLGIGEQQLVEIAKALVKNAHILILDEPTAALSDTESDNLLEILKSLRAQGKTCIYISHRLREVFQISDRVTILRDGKTIQTYFTSDLTENDLIAQMVGRPLSHLYPKVFRQKGPSIFEVRNWSVESPETHELIVDHVNFSLHEGEVLGIAGLMGAGRTELVMSLFGAYGKVLSGEILLDGKKLKIKTEADAITAGLALVPEDRKQYGLILDMSIQENATLPSLERMSLFGIIDHTREIYETDKFVQKLQIKAPSIEQSVRNLSGGNQQKVVLSKWLMTRPRILILDEPTRGIDIGAKFEIYSLIENLLADGLSIIMISSELPEIIGISDRILVMAHGQFTGEFIREEATQEKIMSCAVRYSKEKHETSS